MLAGEVAQRVVLLDEFIDWMLAAQLVQRVQRRHNAGGIGGHISVAPVHGPFEAKLVIARRRHVETIGNFVVVPVSAVVVLGHAIKPVVDGDFTTQHQAGTEVFRQEGQTLVIGDQSGLGEGGMRHVVLLGNGARPGGAQGQDAPGPVITP
ncbi:hypothetical protein G6F32_016236 [Rhizopus arrhizus]|nr:hypothetical protein G6F32_016236 [Rhizopus arrhizus]